MHQEELVLDILRKSDFIKSQPSLAKELGYSVGKINFVLKALIDRGLIKVENFANSKSKKNYKYLLTQNGIKEKIALTKKYVARKKKEYDELHAELEMYRQSELV